MAVAAHVGPDWHEQAGEDRDVSVARSGAHSRTKGIQCEAWSRVCPFVVFQFRWLPARVRAMSRGGPFEPHKAAEEADEEGDEADLWFLPGPPADEDIPPGATPRQIGRAHV